MASSMGHMGLLGSAGAHRFVRKGGDGVIRRRGSCGVRQRQAPSLKGLRKEDAELLKQAEYMSAEEQAELRRLLEENHKLREVVTSSAKHMSPQQLERFTREYNSLATQAAQAGVAVEAGMKQVATSAASQGTASLRSSSSTSSNSASAGGRLEATASASSGGNGAIGYSGSSREYAREMASMSVELDSSLEDDHEEQQQTQHGGSGLEKQVVPAASTRTEPFAAAASRFEALLSERRPAGVVNAVQAQLMDAREAPPPPSGAAQHDPAAEAARKASLRAAAAAEVESHDPRAVVAGREHWMIITVPEKPVAGAPMKLYFNRNQSEKLRHRPHIVLQYGYNHWELVPETGNRAELMPAPLPKNDTMDFWSCTVQVPEETFEVNFILHDNNGLYENNNGMDFTYDVEAGITYDIWIDTAAERAVAKELARKEAEAKAAEEAKRQAAELMAQQAKEFGKRKAEDLKNNISQLQDGAVTVLFRSGVPVYRVLPTNPVAGGKVRLQYNRMSGPFGKFPIPEEQTITMLYGFNGWQSSGKAAMTRVPPPASAAVTGPIAARGFLARQLLLAVVGANGTRLEEDWFETEVALPKEAVAMNFVFNYYEHYDNNSRQDYKVKVVLPPGLSIDTWADQVAEQLREKEYQRRVEEQRAAEEKARRAEEKKKAAQDFVKAVERRKVRHVLFTDPEVVTAGSEVTVFYNPRDTPLNGRQQIYLMGGWNRWTHKRHFGPIAMHRPVDGGEHWQATLTVPKDAFKMDFVFADVPGGDGTYDNRGGFDYHLPVEGSPVREPPLYVCHIAVEMAPIAKVGGGGGGDGTGYMVGGLGDVVTALGRAVKEQGHTVEVVLPRYDFFLHSPVLKDQLRYETEFDWGGTRIYVTTAVVENVRVFFIEPKNGFFATPTVYGRYDDEVRFDFFCKAALEFLLKTGRQPDILHCHDWSTAHVAQSYWSDYHPYGLFKPRVVFTIHNLNYGQKKIGEAAHSCQKFTTVSPTYAFEVGGHPVIGPHAHKFMGIRNGIDPELWSPEENQFLPVCYSSDNVEDGKKAARQALRQRLGLTTWNDKFIVAVVSRLTGQKGVPLIKHAAFRAVDRGGQFVLLGSAPDPKVQADFNALAGQMGGQDAAFCFKYDEPLSHLIYAAADMVVVPSMFEPCGLTQMIAMRYGAVPVVRHTGGLRDTVFDVDFDKERAAWELYGSSDWQRDGIDATNGFAFSGTDGGALDYALNRAIDAWYNDRAWFRGLQKRVMEQDWSWNRPAIDYIELYFSALKS
ncbi:hypothetical protein VOLCADRAFT_99865 [Volvox carteri f. nagariensis]|uniref:starch synthase n=1 Tax=Volvox carteri f. nagariensis TaxID=3068 RepID=D8UIU4_VOLCA|nr:uncharacterized protein VOLCADRAFT_99865 [Volvox carteri f. nagariensis]EFJ40335.1 hypothetical protein VOLCADRAFT_99865 [Volvox carteri f. nagariensis]|eukprot:XP_002958598.1 hypothetical protein VOLCADRAFT_99865 [Volvox carteri f. nagariensis]